MKTIVRLSLALVLIAALHATAVEKPGNDYVVGKLTEAETLSNAQGMGGNCVGVRVDTAELSYDAYQCAKFTRFPLHEFVINGAVELRLEGARTLVLRRPNGKEIKLKITRRTRRDEPNATPPRDALAEAR